MTASIGDGVWHLLLCSLMIVERERFDLWIVYLVMSMTTVGYIHEPCRISISSLFFPQMLTIMTAVRESVELWCFGLVENGLAAC